MKMNRNRRHLTVLCCLLSLFASFATIAEGQSNPLESPASEVRLHLAFDQRGPQRHTPAVLWLEPFAGTSSVPYLPSEHFALLQKNRMFYPHLLVVPVGAMVQFPNKDPFFHNVFSLFDGKRFDLGLYESGSTKSVTFSREGVSYIFCNIHPEMSAVVVSLSSALFSVADANESFTITGVPVGDYKLHIWAEGVPFSALDAMSKTLHPTGGTINLGTLSIPLSHSQLGDHTNKFGQPYPPAEKKPY
jgi:plastocyanin